MGTVEARTTLSEEVAKLILKYLNGAIEEKNAMLLDKPTKIYEHYSRFVSFVSALIDIALATTIPEDVRSAFIKVKKRLTSLSKDDFKDPANCYEKIDDAYAEFAKLLSQTELMKLFMKKLESEETIKAGTQKYFK